jgi:hypothetical protein
VLARELRRLRRSDVNLDIFTLDIAKNSECLTKWSQGFEVSDDEDAMRRIRSVSCARASSGQAAAPPSSVMKSRRVFIR